MLISQGGRRKQIDEEGDKKTFHIRELGPKEFHYL